MLGAMYAQFFGLQQEPFSIAPDPRYLYMSERHREALAHLLYGLGGGGGFVLLTGEIGAGKTTVCRCFLEQIPKRCNVAYIFNPKLTVVELLRSVCDEYHIPYQHPVPGTETVKDYIDPLNAFLLRTHGVGQNNVLIIDEAQNLSLDVLEQLRLLTNLETNERKLLQIILIGQPELRGMLAQPGMEQLAQRVIARFHLQALSQEETAHYIRHRLAVAGLTAAMPFEAKAMQRIHQLARGVPRRINLLCDRALLGAYAEGEPRVTRRIVDKAAGEVFVASEAGAEPRQAAPGRALWLGLGALGGVVLAGIVGLALRVESPPQSVVAAKPAASAAAAASSPLPAARSASAPAAIAASGAGAAVAASAQPAGSVPLNTAQAAAAAPASAATVTSGAELGPLMRDDDETWRTLAKDWKLDLSAATGSIDLCRAAQQQQVFCFRSNAGLALIRQIDRPGIVRLRDAQGKPGYALLTGLGDKSAILRTATGSHSISLPLLATMWAGDFATFWRAPPGYTGSLVEGSSGPAVDGLVAQLAKLDGVPAPSGKQNFGPALTQRLSAFQLAQGLKPDGYAGPTTFMLLNRATGVDEPRLQAEH